MVALRKLGDIQALNRSHDVRQFGSNMGLLEGEEGERCRVERPARRHPARARRRRAHQVAQDPRSRVHAEEDGAAGTAVARRAGDLIDGFIDRGGVDAYLEWCEPLPSSIFLSIMGIPASQLEASSRSRTHLAARSIRRSPPRQGWPRSPCDAWFAADFDRREESGDYGEDLIGWLMNTEVDGRRISRDELHGICNLLMIAGLDTVAASLSCILAHLARPRTREALWPIRRSGRWASRR